MRNALYEIRDLIHCYGERVVLRVPEWSIREGSIVGLTGPNGSGKSTLLRILAFVEPPTQGIVRFEGREWKGEDLLSRRSVTLLFQDPYLLRRSVFENVAYGLRVRKETRALKERVYESLTWVGLSPEVFAHRKWSELSGGEAQRVALASRLVLRPRVLLLDEPTSALDPASAALIHEASLRARNEWGTTLVVASHDIFRLQHMADEVLILYQGRIGGTGAKCFISGPWRGWRNGFSRRELSDGQGILAVSPPDPSCVGMLDASDVVLDPEGACRGGEENVLWGMLSEMIHDPGSGEVLVRVNVAEVPVLARVPGERIPAGGVYPGCRVRVRFPARSVEWLGAPQGDDCAGVHRGE